MSGIQDYFIYVIKKHEAVSDNHKIRKYITKIENRITFLNMFIRTYSLITNKITRSFNMVLLVGACSLDLETG